MSIDKWLSENNKKKPEKNYSEEEIQEGKKRKISELIEKPPKIKKLIKQTEKSIETDDFHSYFMEFKNWLDQRTYLKGDMDKIEIWIKNLYAKIESEKENEESLIQIPQKKKTNRRF